MVISSFRLVSESQAVHDFWLEKIRGGTPRGVHVKIVTNGGCVGGEHNHSNCRDIVSDITTEKFVSQFMFGNT